MKRKLLALCGLAAALTAPRAAIAQSQPVPGGDSPQWLKDRKYNEGIGIRAGDLELHPGIAGEFGYDSNWLLRSDRSGVDNGPHPNPLSASPPAPIVPALEFRITPSLYVSTIGAQRREGDQGEAPPIAFRAGVNATYREFICLGSNCSGTNDITQQRNVSLAADARVDMMLDHPVGGSIYATYLRSVQPNLTTVDPNLAFTNDSIGVGADLVIQPGGGTLDWHFGYELHGTLFEDSPGQGFDNLAHSIYTRGHWKFRPRTALFYDASLGFTTFTNSNLASQQGLVNSTPVSARLGLNGLVTDRLSVLAAAGWASTFNETSSIPHEGQFDSVIAQAELRWFLSASPGLSALSELGLTLSSIALGYARTYQPSYLGNFYGSDRGYLRFNYLFAGRAVVTLEGGVGAIEYPDLWWAPQPPTFPTSELRHKAFTDTRVDATLFGEYRFTNTLGLNATLRYTTNISGAHDVPDIEGMQASVFDMQWSRLEAFLGVRWFM